MPQEDLKEQYLKDERQRLEARKKRVSKLDLDIHVPDQPAVLAAKPASRPRQIPIQQKRIIQQKSVGNCPRTPFKEVPFPQPTASEKTVPKAEVFLPELELIIKQPKAKKSAVKYIGRGAIVFFTLLLLILYSVFALCFVIAKGPSETARNLAVQSALQASATKWVPGLFLDDKTIAEIIEAENNVVQDVVSLDDYVPDDSTDGENSEDQWETAIDGMLYETVSGSTYKAYVLRIKDPTRVFVGISSSDYKNATAGINIFAAAEKYNAVAGINAGEFADAGGVGTGYAPIGLTYSQGECVWNDGAKRTFIGFDSENHLIVRESMTKSEADALGIRDAVSFQTGNTLIEKDGENVILYYAEGNTGTAQRTAIGQCADGTVILICTDGRTASSLGATHNDMIDLMVSYGAVSAGMLDGGSSSMMYYRDYFNKYETDTSLLDKYQLQGLVNKYKAFTAPRRMPTFFMVSGIS